MFKTHRESEWRHGIAVGPDVGDVNTVTDMNGKAVEPIWDYKVFPANGCLVHNASTFVESVKES